MQATVGRTKLTPALSGELSFTYGLLSDDEKQHYKNLGVLARKHGGLNQGPPRKKLRCGGEFAGGADLSLEQVRGPGSDDAGLNHMGIDEAARVANAATELMLAELRQKKSHASAAVRAKADEEKRLIAEVENAEQLKAAGEAAFKSWRPMGSTSTTCNIASH